MVLLQVVWYFSKNPLSIIFGNVIQAPSNYYCRNLKIAFAFHLGV